MAKHPCCLPDGQQRFSLLSREIIPSGTKRSSSFPQQAGVWQSTNDVFLSGWLPGKYTLYSEVQALFPGVFEVLCQDTPKKKKIF